ncbi:unnamed protein product [Medioppia subpectinata]|uniref:Rab-GAP TBC domain-containing protein n=1 Tax=Medioppia subpectinata TaxID=1979941 RepID=A0A7R9KMI9_9ACAR|nr:unnamed protein product [Medioppia subpectinata]CAG2105281.1 unnamed protein product [Medioppia subpectinata]
MMSHLIKYHIPEVIGIEVLKTDKYDNYLKTNNGEEVRRLSVNPKMTPLSVLYKLVVQAFNLNSDFTLSYLRRDTYELCCIQCDLDLDYAYRHNSHPCLQIRLFVDKSNCNSLFDWDIITTSDVVRTQCDGTSTTSTTVLLINQVQKLMNRALEKSKGKQMPESVTRPLNDNELRTFLDSEGKVKCIRDMRIAVYERGVEPSLRKVVWKHLLNVYPYGLTAQQRIDFMKLKCETYCQMRNLWQSNEKDPIVEQTLDMIKKDVMRTDRQHHFYYGNSDDDNDNVTALLNLLTTYSLNHRETYCQGMSDLASPLLYAMKDESHAYICFCALMSRLSSNFNANGEVMSRKFAHLSQLLQYYDHDLYSYLRRQGAHELLFCYRWLLLELKREFPFDDTLLMLEVLWSSMPCVDMKTSLHLFDDHFLYIPNKSFHLRPQFSQNISIDPTLTPTKASISPLRTIKLMPQFMTNDSKHIDSSQKELIDNLH